MDDQTRGAWILHHSNKLLSFQTPSEYDAIWYSGRCAKLLSALSAEKFVQELDRSRVDTIAAAQGISPRTELPAILDGLQQRQLIDSTPSGVAVLGLTQRTILEHTSRILDESNPNSGELGSLELAEFTSATPVVAEKAIEYLSDAAHIPRSQASSLISEITAVGFIDSEDVDRGRKIYFNGNIFRRQFAAKAAAILSQLTPDDQRRISEFEHQLKAAGCLELTTAERILGKPLFDRLNAIGMYDRSTVANNTERVLYVTLPSAFSKFGNALIDDALDLAKALVASLMYGMTRSASGRGRIRLIGRLLEKLIAGSTVGPATAIGQDYKVLELNGVIKVEPLDGLFTMRLLKPEIGRLAMSVLSIGDASFDALTMNGASVTSFEGPETNRSAIRREQNPADKRAVARILDELRSGGGN